MTVRIREATPEDDEAAGELRVRGYAKRYAEKMPQVVVPPSRWADLRDIAGSRRIATVLVAEAQGDDGRMLAGTVTLYRPGAEDNEAWLSEAADLRYLAVAPEHMGKGIASTLVDACEALAREWGCTHVCLHVRSEAEGGLGPFYASRGYVRDPSGDITVQNGTVRLLGWAKRLTAR